MHVLPEPGAIVEWAKGTGLRPVLDRLTDGQQGRFLESYARKIERLYPRRPDGQVILPFERLFVVAYRRA